MNTRCLIHSIYILYRLPINFDHLGHVVKHGWLVLIGLWSSAILETPEQGGFPDGTITNNDYFHLAHDAFLSISSFIVQYLILSKQSPVLDMQNTRLD